MLNQWPELAFDFESELSSLKSSLAACNARDIDMDSRVAHLLSQAAALPKTLNLTLTRAKTRLAVAESDARQLEALLNTTSALADDVSGKVRHLDLYKSRIVECLQRVEDALDLRFCTEGIKAAMANEDYEQAASHVNRFLSLDKAILESEVVENGHVEDMHENISKTPQDVETFQQQFTVMRLAENELRQILFAKFDEALASGDVASMERFFKLFPSLNQHMQGLKKFGSHLKAKIADSASKDYVALFTNNSDMDQSRTSILFADWLTLLLENVARIFEIHQPLVETYYGAEHLLTFARILQEQVDDESGHILNQFVKSKQYNAKSKLIDTYSRQSTKYEHKDKLDPLELDQLLSEVTLLQTRAELYFRFLKRRITTALQKVTVSSEQRGGESKQVSLLSSFLNSKCKDLDRLVRDCRLNCRMQELIGLYIPMEQYYTKEMLRKAVSFNEADIKIKSDNAKFALPLVDDVFYIVRKSLQRAMSSSNVDCLCAVVNNACTLLETDFLSLLQRKIKAGYPASGSLAEAYSTAAAAYASVVQQGKVTAAAAAGQDGAEKARDDFLTAVNDADAAAHAVRALHDALRVEANDGAAATIADSSQQQHKAAKIDGCLGQLGDAAAKFEQAAAKGVERLLDAAVKPRVKIIAERLSDYSNVLDEAQFDDFDSCDPFIEHFVTGLDAMLASFKVCLSDDNFAKFFDAVIDETSRQLERCALKCDFNRLGALLFEKRVRELVAYYAETSSGGYATREKFARLTQTASILNVDTAAEAREFYQSTSVTWRLAAADVRKILLARVDLSADDVRRLKL